MFMVPKMNYPAASSGELNLYPPQEDSSAAGGLKIPVIRT